MKFSIKHEIKGRIRVHMNQKRMTFRQADILQYYLTSQKEVTLVKVYEKNQDAVMALQWECPYSEEILTPQAPSCSFLESERFWKSGHIRNLWMTLPEVCP